jgi:hypothetical protein
MDQPSDLVMKRLAGTLEELGLDRRAYHLLKRQGFHHVGDIIAHGQSAILNIKGMGRLTASHIFSAVARYLNIHQQELFSLELLQRVRSFEERPFDPLDAPISLLDLPLSTLRTLNSFGLFVMRDLLDWNAKGTSSNEARVVSRTEIRRIYTEFNRYLAQTEKSKTTELSIGAIIQPIKIDLSTVLAAILRDERTIQIVQLRALQLLTLEEIAREMGGVTRERIRQIIDQVHERIRENLGLFTMCCNCFEEIADNLNYKYENTNLTVKALGEQYKSQLPDARISATSDELLILVAVVRLVAIHEKAWIYEKLQTRWKKFSLSACFATPPIKTHKGVAQILEKKEGKNRRLSYKELALAILSKEKKPMHWSKIAERAYRIGRRDSFNSTALYNTLMSDPKLFVRVNPGTYALAEWGLNPVDTYPDIIASILKSQKKPLPGQTIFFKVNEIRQIKQATLTMLLDLHPRFYRSLEKTYGLRVWLPEREKQTLRTPEWLIEDSESYKRLERATQRGYDVDSMLRIDQSIEEN